MEWFEYPDLANHVQEHEHFRKKVDELCSAKVAERDGVPMEMLRFLYEWLAAHILFSDKEYAPFVSSHQAANCSGA